jgi:hypothetical protein
MLLDFQIALYCDKCGKKVIYVRDSISGEGLDDGG